MNRFLILVMSVFLLSGCAKLEHLNELLTLQAFSDEKDAQHEYIEKQNAKFEQLLEMARSDSFKQSMDKRRVLKKFGDPIFTKDVSIEGVELEEWLYRYPIEPFGSPKVYLYFNNNDELIRWKCVEPNDSAL